MRLRELNIVFVHIPKNSGRYFKKAIKEHSDIMGRAESLPCPTHASVAEMLAEERKLSINESTRFLAIVRNPFARIVSRFRFRRKEALKRIVRRCLLLTTKETTSLWDDIGIVISMYLRSFEYFLQSDNTPQYSDGMNFQTRSQLNWVQGVDNERVVLIRLERFEEDMNRAIDQGLVDSRFGQIEFGIRAPRTIYRDFFTESARQLVEKAFAADIKRFKYEF